VLGETIVGVISGISGSSVRDCQLLLFAFLGIIISFGYWWVYFDFIARRPAKKGIWWAFTWSYLHLPLLMSIVALGTGILHTVVRIYDVNFHFKNFLLIISFSVSLITLGLLEIILTRNTDEPTHSIVSPATKIAGGFFICLLGFTGIISRDFTLCLSLQCC